MEYESILAIFRGSERLLIVIFGGISLYLGWNLFRRGVTIEQRAEFSKGNFSVTLQKVGPGVFFALFGAAILISATINTFSHTEPSNDGKSTGVNIRYLLNNEDKNKLFSTVEALNTIISVSKKLNDSNFRTEKIRLQQSVIRLIEIRSELLKSGMGEREYNLWKKYRNDYKSNKALIKDESILRTLEDAEKWINAEIPQE